MGVLAVGADARVEVQLVAARAARLDAEPAHERAAVAAAAALGPGDEVVDVQVAPPREVLGEPEAGDAGRVVLALVEGGDRR